MKNAHEVPKWELMSVNQFNVLAEHHDLKESVISKINLTLSTVYDADNLSTRLDALISLAELLEESNENTAVETLHDQCRNIIRLILRGPTDDAIQNAFKSTNGPDSVLDKSDKITYNKLIDSELQKLIDYRLKRLPFKPDFVHDAPKTAPLRELLDDLVDWNNEKDLEIKREKLQKIVHSSTVNTTKIFKPKRISDKLTRERRMFIILSMAHLLKHLLVKGTTKLTTEAYQETDLLREIKVYQGKELEEKRLLPWDEHFYRLTMSGNNNDRGFKVCPFSTEHMSAHGTHKGEAIFVETTAGDFFAASTIDSKNPGESVFHSSLDRHPLFAGRIATDKNGKLLSFDNHTGHLLHNENNLFNLIKQFYELGVLNEDVIATLVMQRSIPTEDTELLSYIRKFPEHANQTSLSDPTVIDGRFIDNLKSDPVNVRGYLATKKGMPIRSRKEAPLPAKDNSAIGIRNDFENIAANPASKKGIQELEEVREKITLKSRLNPTKFKISFSKSVPRDEDVQRGIIIIYPDESSKTHYNYRLRINKKFIDTGKIPFSSLYKESPKKIHNTIYSDGKAPTFEPDEVVLLIKTALKLSTFEQCLMRPFAYLFRHRFPKNSPFPAATDTEKGRPKQPADILAEIAQNISRDAYNAFLEELSHHDKTHHFLDPRLQANNLFFGKKCLFRTNKSTDNRVFDPEKKGQQHTRVLQPLHEINHFKRKDKPTTAKKQSAKESTEVEVVEDDEFVVNLARQKTFTVE